jgi:hypothetical protein
MCAINWSFQSERHGNLSYLRRSSGTLYTMTRLYVLAAMVMIGGLSTHLAALQQPAAGASAAALAATKIEKVKDDLYVITGSSDRSYLQKKFPGSSELPLPL